MSFLITLFYFLIGLSLLLVPSISTSSTHVEAEFDLLCVPEPPMFFDFSSTGTSCEFHMHLISTISFRATSHVYITCAALPVI